jgi:CRP-like cAMP-binding protein
MKDRMETVRPFFQFLHKFIDFSEVEFNDYVRPYLEVRQFKKKELISRPDEIEDYLNFVTKGLARKFYLRGKEEINVQISTEGHIIHSEESFHSRLPSEYTVEAIEPTTVVSITYENLEKVYSNYPKMERLGRLVTIFSLVIKDKRQMNLIRLSPRDRFIDFIHKNPELLQRVPQKYLASYLNIQPETFSRFKHLVRVRKSEGL